MFQESVDRSHGTSKSDLWLFIILIAAFFAIGGVVMYLEKHFSSKIPFYVFVVIVLAAVYLIYRMRLIGYRYTIFYEEPKPVYDPRFDDMMIHEDYPYPVGTLVFERIVSAKGTILLTVDRSEIEAFLAPGEKRSDLSINGMVNNISFRKPEDAYSLVYRKNDKLNLLYIDPSEEFRGYIGRIMNPECEKQTNEKD